ncbi:hypothetical protein SAMN00017405_0387 [Desulfonispora thiosulfatigenes DSM 11270]|uniref:Phage protein n=1 Tax=Desulfonispora thiosulfatigenes DSM 11270 TaxID=656914 RepID=A0A1W1VQ46_DESTI|nr:hypothetical protein [Desulfonispora thiosulfatigenes]SMB95350.1 hypothetical protein SAMN00017405_0387 [Desulfonispora thiosulfatigenes DSM 11270]
MLKQKTVKINGKEFTIQRIPFKSYMDMIDRHSNKYGILMKSPYIEELFKHCVINPKIKMSDFDDDFETAGKLVNEIESFLQTKVNPSSSEKESKE